MRKSPSKCVICEVEVKQDGIKLRSGELICADCAEADLSVVQCEVCEKYVWAADAVRVNNDPWCNKCHKAEILSALNELGTYNAVVSEERTEANRQVTLERYAKYLREEVSGWDFAADRRLGLRLINEGWGQREYQLFIV